ncbi:PREDICTED: 60S ribosomal protein L6 [Papilio xuthus]|uniref:Large ribosomal subunit protein eL6 n=1 Tax=Papilio xuthus TaxID=66420 RepID=I4DID4_PAPXU|nr:60S ribosomal protein L6 [Papilio xuthus]XP_013167638.1 PREDICTED: 60S ribosomal protein L6 [Papilio xuthus]KPI99013.1 60S ribosomal protein L6 [Papilio xuthus]BAM17674.1 ribosomal protein L6 [Papilio xuthus]
MAPPKPKEVAKAPAAPVGKVAKKPKFGVPRNYNLGNGVVRFSKTKMFHKKAKYKFIGKKNPKAEKPKKPTVVVKQIGGEKNGGTRTVLLRRRKSFYPTQDKITTRSHHKTFSKHVRRTRPNLTVGTVCILLAGRHAGKRVVLVGVLPSGLLLVTGPFAFNSCPLRRIPQRYVISTSTKVDLGDFKLPAHLDDDYFKKNKKSTKRSVKRKEGEDIFASKKEKYVPSEQRKADQKSVDEAVIKAIGLRADKKLLRGYLRSAFGLRSSQYPHRMCF